MSFFKKKEPREIKEDDPLIVKLWYGQKSHSAIILGIYLLFLLIVFIFAVSLKGGVEGTSNVTGSSISHLFKNFDNEVLSYNYVLTKNDKTYYFSGKDKNKGIYGTILYNGESTNINFIDNSCIVGDYINGVFYAKYSQCPENIDYKYFNYNNIYEMIKNKKGFKYPRGKYFSFDLSTKLNIKIFYDNDKITKIEVKDDDLTYTLNYLISSNTTSTVDTESVMNILKEAVKDSYDKKYYRSRRKVKINKELYIENVLKSLAEYADVNSKYELRIEVLSELPVNVKVDISSKLNSYSIELNETNFNAEEYIKN